MKVIGAFTIKWLIRSWSNHRWIFVLRFWLSLSSPAHQCAVGDDTTVDFAHDVVPILRQHCIQCHGGGEAEGGFSVNTRDLFLDGEAAEPGDAENSHFLELIGSDDIEEQMPPKDLPRVPAPQQAVLVKWVDAGMPWAEAFTFAEATYQPPLGPREVKLPGPAHANPIDQIIGAYFQQRNLPKLRPADDQVFLRRASLDLIGLLPTPDRLTEFRAETSADKRQQLVDELLADETAYAEHWLTFFNDLLRNDYAGTGFITGGRKQISAWLYRSLIDNKPFDQFTRELVAPDNEASRGFIDGIKWRGTVSAGQTNEIQFAQSVAQSFLGINLKCASCHDSFIDRWKLRDAYSLAAVYASQPLDIHRCDKPTGDVAEAGWLFPELGEIDKDAPRDERLKQLAELMTDRNNGRYARTIVNRLWAQLMGHGIVHPLDAMHLQPWNEDLLDYLANYLVEQNYDLKAVLRLIATSEVYGSRSEILNVDPSTTGDYVFAGRRVKRMTAEQFVDAIWQLTGAAPNTFDAPVLRGKIGTAAINTIKLNGEWIWGDSAADGKQPVAGEQLVFRKVIDLPLDVVSGALVMTVDNAFDLYIARRLVAGSDDWTRPQTVAMAGQLQKGKNEIIVVARNLGDKPNAAGLYFEARLQLADGRQLEIASDESWTFSDKAPVGSREGRLGKTPGPWQSVTLLGRPQVYAKIDSQIRRGLAMGLSSESSMVRASLLNSDFLMRSLGRPNRDQIVSSRPSELTTLEAIDLANGDSLAKSLAVGARRYLEKNLSTVELVEQIYRFALSREPSPGEKQAIAAALSSEPTQQSVEDLLWAICMMPEFMLVR